MRKIKVLILSGILLLTLAGCGGKKETETFQQGNTGSFYGPIMETEHAYYFVNTNTMEYELYYYDKASGKTIFLCNKPECAHDGNEFCAATAGGRYVLYTRLYKDGIYVAALEPEENRIDKKLFKVSLDGTKMETIATYGYDPVSESGGVNRSYDEEKYMLLYDDKAIIPYETPQNDGWMTYGTAIVDLKTGKVQYLKECDSHDRLLGQEGYTPYGEYLYYYEAISLGGIPKKIYRYHLSQKKTVEIPIEGGFSDFCIVDGRVVYSQEDKDGFIHVYSMNPEDADNPDTRDLTGPMNGENGIPRLGKGEGKLAFDREYLVISGYSSEIDRYHYFILSKEGEVLAEIIPPESINPIGPPEFAIVDGNVYFMDYDTTVRCQVQDILNGNANWTSLYSAAIGEEE